jgi:hypothetical protein
MLFTSQITRLRYTVHIKQTSAYKYLTFFYFPYEKLRHVKIVSLEKHFMNNFTL